jgi:hypothetical protein
MKEPTTCPYQCIKKLEGFEGQPEEFSYPLPSREWTKVREGYSLGH